MLASSSRMANGALRAAARGISSTASCRAISAPSLARTNVVSCSRPVPAGLSRNYATSTTPTSTPLDPSTTESQQHLEEGTIHLEAGDLAAAKESYLRSLSIKRNSSALFNLGVCLYHDRDLDGAIKAWKESLELSPESADAHTNLASAYVLSKPSRPDLAVNHLKTAAGITPDDPEIQYNLAAVLEACEQLEEALVAYKRALDGGIQRAEQNIKNCGAKLLSAKFAVREQQEAEAKESGEKKE